MKRGPHKEKTMDHENHSADTTEVFAATVPVPSEIITSLVEQIKGPGYPIGQIDFNQPIIVVDGENHDEVFEDASVLTVLKGSQHPVVVSFWKDGIQQVAQFNADGEDNDGDFTIYNVIEGPRTMFAVLLLQGRVPALDSELYFTRDLALAGNKGEIIIDVVPLTFEPHVPQVTPAPQLDEAFASNEDEVDIDEEEEEDGDIEGTEADNSKASPPDSAQIGSRTYRVGDTISFWRRYAGTRSGTVTKLRNDPYKSALFAPNDGAEPYWARNSNVR
jgi:hypothetical protein